MPDRDRRLLQLVLLEERDKDAVCAELGLSREYLRVLVHRAKQIVQALLFKALWRGRVVEHQDAIQLGAAEKYLLGELDNCAVAGRV